MVFTHIFCDVFKKIRSQGCLKLALFRVKGNRSAKGIKLDENGIKFSKRVENTMEKGEIAHYKQFLLLPQCFQMTCKNDR